MVRFLRFLCAVAALPFACALALVFVDAFRLMPVSGDVLIPTGALCLSAGFAFFLVLWVCLPAPVRLYVLGHELTHALCGLFFGAWPSNLRVGLKGGSVTLTKSNVWITLAPYFFPFYTFLVIVVALITSAFIRPLPCLPLWMFAVGFTWAFHALFTLETLAQRQPDVKLYGRIFSWVFIFLANVAFILLFLASTTSLTFAQLGGFLMNRIIDAYVGVGLAAVDAFKWVVSKCSRT